MLLTEADARQITSKLLSFIKAGDAAVSVSSRIHSYLRFAANAPQTSARAEGLSAQVTVWLDGRRGSASTTDLSDTALRAAVDEAESLARISPVDREYLPTLGRQTYRQVQRFVDATVNLSLDDRARSLEQAIDASETAGVISAGFHQAEAVSAASASSNGNFLHERSTVASLGMTARTRVADGSGYCLRSHEDVRRVDAAHIARDAIRRATGSRSPRALDPGVYRVILEPQAVADIVSGGAFGFDARAADEGRSPFSAASGRTRVGDRIFDERINIVSDPWRAELPGSAAASSGIPGEVVTFVRRGVLENLSYSRYWAREKNRQPTPGPINRIIESAGSHASVDDMIRATDRGLLVTRFWYIRSVDARTSLLTGLTRDGLWYVEKGRIMYPVRNLRFNQSPIQMLAPGNVELIGAAERVSPSESQGSSAMLVPALLLKAFNFTSVSDAV
jgi:predicted Zn-dependent protease